MNGSSQEPKALVQKPLKKPLSPEKRSSIQAVTFESVFPGAKEWHEPKVLNKIRKQALAVLYAALKGKQLDKERLEAAKFAVGKMVAQEAPKKAVFNFISWQDITRAADKAGLKWTPPQDAIDVDSQSIE